MVLFDNGKLLISLYIGSSAITSSYGAAGSLIVVLLWAYYSAQIFLIGAEFTKVYAGQPGEPLAPVRGERHVRLVLPRAFNWRWMPSAAPPTDSPCSGCTSPR